MSIEQEFKEKVSEYLEKLSNDLCTILKELIEYNYPEEVTTLAFEIFVDGFSSEFPVRAFFMDKDNSEHFIYIDGKAEYPSPVDPGLLEIDHVYPYELEEEYTNKDESLDPWDIATNELIEWFSKCWLVSGGQTFNIKATIAR
ncbi:hypothetical protein DXV75_17035 [Alteromonas aestuariivivens]|uniref:Uncharacterized protein n=1 Tax=Alteromonas aestuariivivens TaxID=1938339 RepID=A0A3D8M2L9_9ALTE|nr:hypothetical protein [Alteromonas aestuariivivens]RDV23866.1 hypothetical protein DXV75_17035 [Alteromonas aestuariivivens]